MTYFTASITIPGRRCWPNAYFRCLSCGHQVARDRTIYRYDVHNQCKNCGRYYRVDIEDEERQHSSVLHVACPYCGPAMAIL